MFNIVDSYIVPFFTFIKRIINSVMKLFGGETLFPDEE